MTWFPSLRIKMWRRMTIWTGLQNNRVKMSSKSISSKFRSNKSLIRTIGAHPLMRRWWIIPRMMSLVIKDGCFMETIVILISIRKRLWTLNDRRGARSFISKNCNLRAKTKKWKGCNKIRDQLPNVDKGKPRRSITSIYKQWCCSRKLLNSAKKNKWWKKRSKFSKNRLGGSGNEKVSWCWKRGRDVRPRSHLTYPHP